VSLHISKPFADLIKKLGEDQIMHIVKVWDNRRRWQRERYAKKVKPVRMAARGERTRVHDQEVNVDEDV